MVKYLSSVAIIALSLGLTACSAMKPDHPQVKESFSDRRSPRDNMLAASGAFGEQKEKTSSFQPITPTSVVENNSSKVSQAISQVTHSQPVSTGITQAPAASHSSSSQQEGSFFSRFFDQISSTFKTSSNDISKRSPKSSAYATNASYSEVEQGGRMGYTFYDMADEMLPANPVHKVVHQEIPSLTSERSMVRNSEFGYITRSNMVHLAQASTPTLPSTPAAPSAPVAPVVETQKNIAPAPAQPAAPEQIKPTMEAASSMTASTSTSTQTPVAAPTVPVENKVVPQAPEMPSATPTTPTVTASPVKEAPAQPLTNVPATPSVDEMKDKAQSQPEPKLNETPKVPEEFKSPSTSSETTEKKEEPVAPVAKPKPKKVVKKVKLPKEESKDPVAQNPNSQTIYMMNGKKVTMGFLERPAKSSE